MQPISENIVSKIERTPSRSNERFGANSANPSFVAMAESHVMLFSSLKLYLQGELEGSNGDFVDHWRRCELGKWLQGEGEMSFAHLKPFGRLRDVHNQFHVDVDAVLEKLHEGSWIAAEQLSKSDLSQSLRRLLMALTELNDVISEQAEAEVS